MANQPQNPGDKNPRPTPAPHDVIPHPEVERAQVEPVNRPEERSLYKKRENIYPKRANGTFRNIKWAIMVITLGIYYLSPWIRWDRGEGLPDQAILIDFPGRRFYFFFIEIWPQEVYYITGLLILAAIGLFLVTSTAGRMWCGYTCPQTVWVDLFLVVERFFEGDRNERIKLDKAPWSLAKIRKKLSKHITWLLIGVATGGAWVFYFADAPTLFQQLLHFEADPNVYFWIALFTSTTYLLGGFAREQVCTYMCPWPRIQSVMLDEDSLAVMYRYDRGEPRGPHKKGESWEGRGDCVQCRQCVVVCPQGIDIRDGMQLECIQCSLCIDACNEVMDKIGRPRGLIAYDSLANFEARAKGEKEHFRLIRPRTIIYSTLILVVGGFMLYTLLTRAELEVNVLRDRNPVFVQLSSGDIRNGYTLKILNKSRSDRDFAINVTGLDNYEIRVEGVTDMTENGLPVVHVEKDRLRSVKVYVSAHRKHLAGSSTDISFVVHDVNGPEEDTKDTNFKGPK
ncbi:cytochrome c oxidase accessory protein CcoG [Emcibacter sp.]|uniref:cytochrome c oxidase accessory protein CcoG n=1 Tax=Emcibacter sp. TaxID=1979954 RepID=UPI002AA884F0|nr:cytochrome c oxidase accessory protein CcoG [Emcibacter sp.]